MRFFLTGIILIFFVTHSLCQSVITASTDSTVNVSDFEYILDSTKSLGEKDVFAKAEANQLQKYSADAFVPGYHVYWIHFYVENKGNFDEEWVMDFQNWSYVTAYLKDSTHISEQKTGHLYPYNKRDYKVANKAYILLKLKAGERKNYVVRLESKYNNELVPAALGFKIIKKEIADKQDVLTGKVIYSFLSIFLVMFIYNLFISFSTRLKSYSLYLIVIFFAFYHTAYNSGYLIELFGSFDKFPVWLTHFETFSSNLFGIAVLMFVSEFLSLKKRYPTWYKIFRILIISFGVSMVIILLHDEAGAVASSLVALLTIIAIIIVSVKSAWAKYPASEYFLIGFTAFLLSIVVLIFSLSGAIPSDFRITSFVLPIGTCIEIIFFAFALGNLINRLRLENEKNQEKIINQLEENQNLQTKVNRELEEKVRERTIEINKQKEQISIQKEKIELEKGKSDELLLNMLPKFTANELKEKGYAVPKRYENVTIIFTDFVDFTKISEKLNPEKLVEELDTCFKSFDEIISNNYLEKIKTIGDSYMAICGAPVADINHAFNTVNTAIQIREFIETWNTEKRNKGEAPWEIRIGIHSGYVIGGVVGKKKFTFDIWSDTVNTASRMESSGENGKINISGITYDLIKSNFSCEYRGKVKAKNKGEMDMYFVLDKQVG